ncbi:Biopolymer transport protein ExbD/TolR [Thiorhodococcus drewsii AZ1]|uniref:Biopolymer transport protein ExbD/TolR n=1 Tax=Thiorhodococcus drewsii AZ1 TaxID=765913 RepID=G2E4C4_9GAMM|nr:biopolymer transporter ExbD [Thiorhodococcus drewsii]EGV29693.1 Biopolymer transport protein ExbD/TolR [Thiorhodococcus drewsii AZ1]
MKRIDQINVLPFIDIMLVLLAIVLTTATFISDGRMEIRLPTSTNPADAPPPHSVEIAIDADGAFYLDAEPVTEERLATALDGLETSTPIVLRVDAATRFERFVAVVDQLKTRKLERLTILTRKS